jgi:hypothetical protein
MAYSTSTTLTITLASLGNGSARESNSIDNSSTLYKDIQFQLTTKVGTVSGAPQVVVWIAGSENGTVWPETGLTGADAAASLSSPTLLGAPAIVIPTPVSTTSYKSQVFSAARMYGGALPRKLNVVVRNDSGAALSATGGDHSLTWTGIS